MSPREADNKLTQLRTMEPKARLRKLQQKITLSMQEKLTKIHAVALEPTLVISHETKHFCTGQREMQTIKHMRVMGDRWTQSGIMDDG